MSDAMDMHFQQLSLGTLAYAAAGTIPLMYVPPQTGGVTLIQANLMALGNGLGTLNGVRLVTLTNPTGTAGTATGTPVLSGTLGTIAAASWTPAVTVNQPIPLTTAWVAAGTAGAWIGLQFVTGTILADAALCLNYVMGH